MRLILLLALFFIGTLVEGDTTPEKEVVSSTIPIESTTNNNDIGTTTGVTSSGQSTTGGGGSSTTAPLTSTIPIDLATLKISNELKPEKAKLILQKAVYLNNQIVNLNQQIQNAIAYTDPENSPFFGQLEAINNTLKDQTDKLNGYINQLNKLQNNQDKLNSQTNNMRDIFNCFSQSNCVTDTPTTAEPTTPGPTPPAAICDQSNVTSVINETNTVSESAIQNADCNFNIKTSNSANYLTLTINVTINGNAYLEVTETRTSKPYKYNSSVQDQFINITSNALVHYFADPRSRIEFSIDYLEVSPCTLQCQNGGQCVVSNSGSQYCECPRCQFTGDFCETQVDPCKAKQKRNCGEIGDKPYGICYINQCYDSCYACECVDPIPGNPLKCNKPSDDWTTPPVPTQPTCTTTPMLTSTTTQQQSTSTAAAGNTTPTGTTPLQTTGSNDNTTKPNGDASTAKPGTGTTKEGDETTVNPGTDKPTETTPATTPETTSEKPKDPTTAANNGEDI